MGYLNESIYINSENEYLKDFNNDFIKVNTLPFSFLNTISNDTYDHSCHIESDLLKNNIYYDSLYTSYLRSHRQNSDKLGFDLFTGIYRINPIAKYEAFQYYRLNHILLNITEPLNRYFNIVMFKVSFQATYKYKIKAIQKEINKILSVIDNGDETYAWTLLFDELSRSHLGITNYVEFILTFYFDISEEQASSNIAQDDLRMLLYYICDGFDNEYWPFKDKDKKWAEFELSYFKLLMLRRLIKSVAIMDDFFKKDRIEINASISLSIEDTKFFNQLALILKSEKDKKFIASLLTDDTLDRKNAFFDNLYAYLKGNINIPSRLTTVNSSTYKRMVIKSYPMIKSYTVSSNILSVNAAETFKLHDKK